MATKAAIEKGEERSIKRQEPGALKEFGGSAMGMFSDLTRFLSDVRAEMKKVVAPSAKEVRMTTSVVIVTVFLFGLYFFLVDGFFKVVVYGLLGKLGGSQ
jgi:preprotein translocase subunit SecE